MARKKSTQPLIIVIITLILSAIMGEQWLSSGNKTPNPPQSPDVTSPSGETENVDFNQCSVVNVTDGDTLRLRCVGANEDIRVRLYCIDAPESKQTPWGTSSKEYLRSIAGNTVRVVKINIDRYQRVVGEIYNGNANLNLAMVKAGKAAVYRQYCKKREPYEAAEEQAQHAKEGIWKTEGLHQTPWEWRKQQREMD
ncbi:thermonuclease family protein [Beggiatoa leptomitoformis]|uniref:Thermonuclease family protein n=1 Tax=Beggiatoa leptomitoformis TaxID=288004 RepID=A0A2N9YGK6_9GAMM|nr:thermonuclease family protein [Beggiatoa leptomitoformis]AUI69529.1 thermonuclease family protein [Beggiatoa leptomitoformis]QGX03704.1 thermonuclease family protein [Beggiatoa leptomitoformis]